MFGPSDGHVEGPPVCAVAVARGFRGYGKGVTQSDALASAVGEALEQYAASRVRGQQLRRASFREIEGQAFDPRWLCLYNDEKYRRVDFPYRRFDPDRPLHWTRGQWLDTGEAVYLPAFAVWLANAFEEEALCQVTSNGLAAGRTVPDAAGRAVLELYERDAFLNSWIAHQFRATLLVISSGYPERIGSCK
jgi:ribosomal protein S12 methylthiotransferase accessory factor